MDRRKNGQSGGLLPRIVPDELPLFGALERSGIVVVMREKPAKAAKGPRVRPPKPKR